MDLDRAGVGEAFLTELVRVGWSCEDKQRKQEMPSSSHEGVLDSDRPYINSQRHEWEYLPHACRARLVCDIIVQP
jgi:hypothetical protein